MSRTRMAYVAFMLLSTAMPATAASFNCAIADRPDEVLICQNERLSSLDERVHRHAVDLASHVWEAVHRRFLCAPVVPVTPVRDELVEVVDVRPERPAGVCR